MILNQLYREVSQSCLDLKDHIPHIRGLAEQCQHVTEFGCRDGNSTIALLAGSIHGKLKRVVGYDPVLTPQVEYLVATFPQLFTYKCASSLSERIEPTDLLFIDSLHTYQQLSMELALQVGRVNRWIVIHDTTTYGNCGEDGGFGLLEAINEFLAENPFWQVHRHYPSNNGLTVLGRNCSIGVYSSQAVWDIKRQTDTYPYIESR